MVRFEGMFVDSYMLTPRINTGLRIEKNKKNPQYRVPPCEVTHC